LNADDQHINPNELLVKYLADEARADERAMAEQWIAATRENGRQFEHLKLLWNASQQLALQTAAEADVDAAWDRFRKRVEKGNAGSLKQRSHFSWLQAAAVMLVLAAAAMVGKRLIGHHDIPVIQGPVKKLKLPTAPKIDTVFKKQPDADTLHKHRPEKNGIKKMTTTRLKAIKPDEIQLQPDLSLQPDTLQKITHEPVNWPLVPERYPSPADNLAIRRAIVGHLLDEMTAQQLAGQVPVSSFMLNENEFFINGKRQPDSIQQWYRMHFIKSPGFFIYFGSRSRPGQGICLSPDSLQ
jgi:hypothetical protein